MVRNNKYNVTDLLGNRFFTEPEVCSTTYSYSCDEQIFYETLTEFISNGMAYASRLNHETGRIVMFVLISMQKLASSSVAAIKHALRKRVNRYKEAIVILGFWNIALTIFSPVFSPVFRIGFSVS
jgi:hypothetical protein